MYSTSMATTEPDFLFFVWVPRRQGEALELIDADFFGGHIEDYDSQNGGFQFLLYRGGADQSGLFCSCDLGLC
jgi:hypothetical protein